jgi:MoaA/NifB/PqqE/SkfB family radical SAM enzyme
MEIDMPRSRVAIEQFAELGARAVTITGGGEPMMYSHIGELINCFVKNKIEIGLVTNGINYKTWDYDVLSQIRWLRMSIHDEYDFWNFDGKIETITKNLSSVDVALSYVVGQTPDNNKINQAMQMTNKYELTHIRYVSDILAAAPRDNGSISIADGVNTSRAIFQPREQYETNNSDCWISLAKPVVAADGHIYPCCGVQYARPGRTRDMNPEFDMGEIKHVFDIWSHQFPFDGSRCEKCYYGGYNRTLAAMRSPVRHTHFI